MALHPPPFCDACKSAIAAGSDALIIKHPLGIIHLCDTCSVIVVAMLSRLWATADFIAAHAKRGLVPQRNLPTF